MLQFHCPLYFSWRCNFSVAMCIGLLKSEIRENSAPTVNNSPGKNSFRLHQQWVSRTRRWKRFWARQPGRSFGRVSEVGSWMRWRWRRRQENFIRELVEVRCGEQVRQEEETRIGSRCGKCSPTGISCNSLSLRITESWLCKSWSPSSRVMPWSSQTSLDSWKSSRPTRCSATLFCLVAKINSYLQKRPYGWWGTRWPVHWWFRGGKVGFTHLHAFVPFCNVA